MKDRTLKFVRIGMGILFVLFLSQSNVRAEEIILPPERTDVGKIQIINAEPLPKIDTLWDVKVPAYYFTKKSAGKYIPVTSPVDGTLLWQCEDLYFVTPEKERIDAHGFYTEGYPMGIYNVKKNRTYYVYVPEDVDMGTIVMFVYPDNVKKIKPDTTYFQTGSGKNNYKYFTLKKTCLIDFICVHASIKGASTTYYLQKKVKGKWKTITKKRKIDRHHLAESMTYRAPYGLAKGKYRLVSKTVKGGKYWIRPEIRAGKNEGQSNKRKAKRIRNGRNVQGIFTYGDKKVHWYKVKADREVRLTFTTSMEPYGVTFTIYKNGINKPVKTLTLKGKSGKKEWEQQYKRSKKYTLEDGDGTYYIKVSRKHAMANGWYSIEN